MRRRRSRCRRWTAAPSGRPRARRCSSRSSLCPRRVPRRSLLISRASARLRRESRPKRPRQISIRSTARGSAAARAACWASRSKAGGARGSAAFWRRPGTCRSEGIFRPKSRLRCAKNTACATTSTPTARRKRDGSTTYPTCPRTTTRITRCSRSSSSSSTGVISRRTTRPRAG